MFDQNLMFSETADTTLTSTAATVIATKTIDTWEHADVAGSYSGGAGVTPRGGPHVSDYGAANDFKILIIITEAVVGATATVAFEVVQCDAAAGTGNVEILDQTKAIPVANLTLGKWIAFRVPNMNRRYLSLNYVIGTATTTAGKCCAGLVCELPTNVANRIIDQT